jgi:hypothetical protein
MAKVTVDISGMMKKLEKVQTIVDSGEGKTAIGVQAVKSIKGETRLQKDLKNERKQPSLEKSTVKQREYLESFGNNTGKNYGTAKSNLTMSGQLIESLTFEPVKGGVRIFVPDTLRTPYKTGGKGSKPITNAELAKHLKDQGREFIGVDDKIKKILASLVQRFIRRSLRIINK